MMLCEGFPEGSAEPREGNGTEFHVGDVILMDACGLKTALFGL